MDRKQTNKRFSVDFAVVGKNKLSILAAYMLDGLK